MGFKVFICSVCGKEVSRKKSYALPDGTRACREHEVAQSGRQELQKREIAKKAAEQTKRRKIKERGEFFGEPFWGMNHCWTCGAEGTPPNEIKDRMMIAWEKVRLKAESDPFAAPINFLSPNFFIALRKESGIENPLIQFVVSPERMGEILNRTKHSQRQAVEFVGITQICPKCAKELGMEPPSIPEINIENLSTMSAIYDVMVRPAVEDRARAEIREEVARN